MDPNYGKQMTSSEENLTNELPPHQVPFDDDRPIGGPGNARPKPAVTGPPPPQQSHPPQPQSSSHVPFSGERDSGVQLMPLRPPSGSSQLRDQRNAPQVALFNDDSNDENSARRRWTQYRTDASERGAVYPGLGSRLSSVMNQANSGYHGDLASEMAVLRSDLQQEYDALRRRMRSQGNGGVGGTGFTSEGGYSGYGNESSVSNSGWARKQWWGGVRPPSASRPSGWSAIPSRWPESTLRAFARPPSAHRPYIASIPLTVPPPSQIPSLSTNGPSSSSSSSLELGSTGLATSRLPVDLDSIFSGEDGAVPIAPASSRPSPPQSHEPNTSGPITARHASQDPLVPQPVSHRSTVTDVDPLGNDKDTQVLQRFLAKH